MKNVKKILALATMSAVFCCTAAFTACEPEEHEHTWGDWEITTPATCTQQGEETRVCEDDPTHKETRKVDELGHDWNDWTLTTSATCTTAGEETRTCKRDELHTETRAAGEASGHKWDDGVATTPASCTEEGVKTFTCTVDGCNVTKTESIAVVSSAHNWGDWSEKSAATCTAAKVEERVCAHNPEHKETQSVGEANGHSWDEGTVTTQPTESKPGVKTFKCNVAGCDGTKTEPVPELGHEHSYTGEWQKDDNEHWKVCDGANCVEKGLKATHDWDEGKVTTVATCTTAGVKTYTCETCSATKTEPVAIDATAHDWGEWADKTAATCIAAKVQERVCARNPEHKETQSVGEVDPEAHNWGEWKVTENPTDNKEGTATRTCSHTGCDATDEKVLHTITTAGIYIVTNDTATCEKAGTANYKYAFNGGEVSFTAATPAKGHIWGAWSVTAPSENAPGSATKVCEANGCQGKKQTVLPALSEKDEYQYEDSSTCEMDGNEVYVFVYSDADGSEYIQVKNQYAPAKGHSFGEWTEKSPATCTTAKVEERVCSHDEEHTETRTVGEALGHVWGTYTKTGGGSLSNSGKVKTTCTRENCLQSEEYSFDGDNNNGTALNGVNDGKTYYINATADKNLTITLKGTSVKSGTYEFSFRYLCDEAIVLNANNTSRIGTTIYLEADTENGGYKVVNTFENNIILDYTANKLTKVTFKVDGDKIADSVDIKLGMKLTASTKYLLSITYLASSELSEGLNNVKVTGEASGDEYTFTPTESKEYSINVPKGMQVLMNGTSLINRGEWANFEATENEPITFKFINDTEGTYAVTIGDAKPTEFTVGGNDIRISQAGMLADTSVDKYTFTPEEDKTYSLTIPNGMVVLMNDTELITHGTWANFTATAGETITFTFLNSEEGTFVAIIANEILPAALNVGEEAEVDMVVGIVSKIVIEDDVAEGVYKISLEGDFLIAKKTGYGQMYLMIGGDGSYETVKNSDNYMQALIERDENGVKVDCSVTPWTVTATLKAGDEIFIVPAISAGNGGISAGEYLTTITVTLKRVTDITKGLNDIKISETNESASYTFTPAETKVYSLTVPEGMTVLKNDENFITEGTSANFEATAGETITFTFIYAEEGTYIVTLEAVTE